MKNTFLKKKKLPDAPGVYLFKKGKKVLYVGKATSLRNRTKSYTSPDILMKRGPIIEKMIEEASGIDWQVTDSVLEALLLEAELIKKHQPVYNSKEKSDKSFLCVVITDEKLPRVMLARARNLQENSGAFKNIKLKRVFGPFTSGSQLKEGIKIIRKIFPFLDEKSKNYEEFYRQINLIPDLKNRKMYLQNIRNISLFFQGKKKKIVQNLKKEMKAYAKNKEFEKAGEIKRQLFALQHINDVALIKEERFAGHDISGSAFRIEAYDIAHMSGKNIVGVMVVVEDGEVNKNEYRKFSARGGTAFGGKTVLGQSSANDTKALAEILERRLSHQEWARPNLIVVDGSTAQINATKRVLKKFNLGVPVVSVVKDDRHKPMGIKGDARPAREYEKEILLANAEAHRFAIAYHRKTRGKNFLK